MAVTDIWENYIQFQEPYNGTANITYPPTDTSGTPHYYWCEICHCSFVSPHKHCPSCGKIILKCPECGQ